MNEKFAVYVKNAMDALCAGKMVYGTSSWYRIDALTSDFVSSDNLVDWESVEMEVAEFINTKWSVVEYEELMEMYIMLTKRSSVNKSTVA